MEHGFIFSNKKFNYMVRHGITGNMYITSVDKDTVKEICEEIGKSKNSVYYSEKYKMWAARIKSDKHRKALKELVKSLMVVKWRTKSNHS